MLLLQQATGLGIQLLILLQRGIDQLKDILTHGGLDEKLIHDLLGLARGVPQLLLGRDGLVEAQDVRLQGHDVLILRQRLQHGGKGG